MQREAMSKVDTAWLRMEQPTNLMMITGVIGLGKKASYENLIETISQRFLTFRRFRQKVTKTSSGAYWEIDEDFDLHGHVRRVALPGAADQDELEEYVSDLASTALDPSRPLWQFHYVENFVDGPVVVTRIHHCYADGIALVQVFLSLTDTERTDIYKQVNSKSWKKQRVKESSVFQRLLEPAKDGVDFAIHKSQQLLEEAVQILQQPDKAGEYLTVAGELLRELSQALLLPNDPPSRFKGKLGVRKRVAWADPIPLEEVRALGKSLGCTVNDVLIAAVSGALRAYLQEREHDLENLPEIRATVPVNLRPLEHAKELGNHFGLVFLALPVNEANPLERVYRVQERMNELKASRQATVAFGLLAALGMGPHAVQKPALDLLSEKATMVLTNVPGPQQPLYLAGGEVKDMMFWVPQSGTIGMGVSILSYNGQVFFGLMTDRRLVNDPAKIIDRFGVELEKLLKLAMMLPLGERPCRGLAEDLLSLGIQFLPDEA
ncbi:MAG: wax ester/triacylglycerol synthase family O-acyltransferase [Xanthomonadales bacterium]|nr:wax ester/triacylglycerol synthase family O-acyltransferase [Xanthomonadales bacterium]